MITYLSNCFKKQNKNGFTLIEIVVSLAVIGILFSISVVSYGNWKQRTTITQAKSDLSQLATAFEDYKNTNNAYPSDITKLANFKASSGLTITGGSNNGNYFCINVKSVSDNTISYYLTSLNKEAQSGECPAHGWLSLSASSKSHSVCGILGNNQVYRWGENGVGQLGNNTTTASTTPVAVSQGAMPSLSVKSISTGGDFACAIGSDDQAYCWGEGLGLGKGSLPDSSVPVAVSLGSMASLKVKSISAGYDQACAIGFDDKAYCWGGNSQGQLGNNSSTNSLVPVAVSQGVMTTTNIKMISAGYWSTCAIGFDDKAYCWGYNWSGQLGNDSVSSNILTPVNVLQGEMTSLNVKSISASGKNGGNTCAIGFDDKAYCWGSHTEIIGIDSISLSAINQNPTPVVVPQISNVKYISTGDTSTCAIDSSYKIYCWGYNSEGQLGTGSISSKYSSSPAPVIAGQVNLKQAKSLTIGSDFACAVDVNMEAYCWGNNLSGVLNIEDLDRIKTPNAVSQGAMPFQNTKSFSTGGSLNCSIDSSDKMYCWGSGYNGGLGINSITHSPSPAAVTLGSMPSLNVKSVSAGYSSACAINFNNQAYCWGENTFGQLGLGGTADKSVPRAIAIGAMASLNVKSISTGIYNTCAIGFDDKAYCWGDNSSGQLGDNTRTQRNTPVAVLQGLMTSTNVKAISAGQLSTCAIGFDDKAYCWGDNSYGQLGNNSTTQSRTPVAVLQGAMASTSVKSISVGSYNACAIGFDDKAYCWGYNGNGQLGNNSTTQSRTPVAVLQGAMASTSVKSISVGSHSACVIGFDDKGYCWGYNGYGQLGNNSTTQSLIPVSVTQGAMPSLSLKSLATGTYHTTCAIGIDNKSYCWGRNNYGQAGVVNNSIFSHNKPQPIVSPQ